MQSKLLIALSRCKTAEISIFVSSKMHGGRSTQAYLMQFALRQLNMSNFKLICITYHCLQNFHLTTINKPFNYKVFALFRSTIDECFNPLVLEMDHTHVYSVNIR